MRQEGAEELSLRMYSAETFMNSLDHSAQIVGTEIGKFLTLNIAPHAFYWIQFRSVGWQAHRR